MKQAKKYTHEGEPVMKCRACQCPIFFKLLPSGKRMPVNADTLESHFADCTAPADFRKVNRTGPGQGGRIKIKAKDGAA